MNKITLLLATLMLLILTACGGGDTPSSPTTPTTQERAIDKIEAYAQGTGSAPSVQDYLDAGVTGVTADNLNEINAVVAGLTQEDVDTKEEIQALVNGLGLDISVPVFTSAASVTVAENQIAAITLVAVDDATVTYSISGGDSDDFALDAFTGVVTFKTAPDYESKNSYSFTAKASDGSNEATQQVTIHISDMDENAPSLVLNGASKLILLQGKSYVEYGATATDEGSDISGDILIDASQVDHTTIGTYSVEYQVSDAAGNRASLTRVVVVIPRGVKATGQLSSYNNDGDEISDSSIKDDGFYQKGLSSSYTRDDEKEVVLDAVTGLMWQDNEAAKSITKQWVTDENWENEDYNNTSGDTAVSYCEALELGGYSDWRLPSAKELRSIQLNWTSPRIDAAFENVEEIEYYWSATTHRGGEGTFAWKINFAYEWPYNGDKQFEYHVRCVR